MKLFSPLLALAISCSSAFAQDVAPHWDYTGDAAPENWGQLSEAYHLCAVGNTQSPIDIQDSAAIAAVLPALEFRFQKFPLSMVNNGHSIQVAGDTTNGFAVDGHDFKLAQFHFHAPSEYHLNGKSYPMELHLVHQREDNALAVIGVMFEEGAANPALDQIFAHLDKAGPQATDYAEVQLDIAQLLPQDQHYYRLMGSLTTPPCTEGVNWFVMEHPITASAEQIKAFSALFPHGDARPLQAANNRLVVRGIN